MSTTIVFDIETGALPWEQLQEFFEPPAGPGEFDPAAVKFGNLKDVAKIDEKVRAARSAHDLAVAGHAEKVEAVKTEFANRAALDATTGRVLAIGLAGDGDPEIIDHEDEAALLADFWAHADEAAEQHCRLIGFNIFGFDLPFMIRRSWAIGVIVPVGIFDRERRRWHACFVDLAEIYRLGVYGNYIKLDRLAAHLGTDRKSGDGAEFASKWAEDREGAIAYLKQDLVVTRQVAERMGVV